MNRGICDICDAPFQARPGAIHKLDRKAHLDHALTAYNKSRKGKRKAPEALVAHIERLSVA